jgi:dephospho-CoA kinase
MFVLALTGGIGMGKSAVAAMLRARGVPVFDADAAVHRLYAGKAAPLIEAAFPGTTEAGVVDRKRLAAVLAGRPEAFAKLETIAHPLVRAEEQAFLVAERARGTKIACIEIPLLYETGGEGRADAVLVVSAPAAVQRARVLERPGMTPARLDELLARQTSDAEKRARADFVVDTGTSLAETEAALDAILARIAAG